MGQKAAKAVPTMRSTSSGPQACESLELRRLSPSTNTWPGGTTSLGVRTNNPYSAGPANPFCLTWSNVPPGNYVLTAKATDNRAATRISSGVAISVVMPSAIVLSAPLQISATNFQFNYVANVGLRYVVERSQDLTTWTGVVTNIAASNPVVFLDNDAPASTCFYRVARLPNP